MVLDCADVIEAAMTSSDVNRAAATHELNQVCSNSVQSALVEPVVTFSTSEHSKCMHISHDSLPPSYKTLFEDPPPSYEASVRFQEKCDIDA